MGTTHGKRTTTCEPAKTGVSSLFPVLQGPRQLRERVRLFQPGARNGSVAGGERAALRLRPLLRLSAARLCWKRRVRWASNTASESAVPPRTRSAKGNRHETLNPSAHLGQQRGVCFQRPGPVETLHRLRLQDVAVYIVLPEVMVTSVPMEQHEVSAELRHRWHARHPAPAAALLRAGRAVAFGVESGFM